MGTCSVSHVYVCVCVCVCFGLSSNLDVVKVGGVGDDEVEKLVVEALVMLSAKHLLDRCHAVGVGTVVLQPDSDSNKRLPDFQNLPPPPSSSPLPCFKPQPPGWPEWLCSSS